MITVKQVLQTKGYDDTWTIASNVTVFDALKLLSEKDVGALPVVDGDKLASCRSGITPEKSFCKENHPSIRRSRRS